MWLTEMELRQSLSRRGSSSNDGAIRTDDDFWTAKFHNRILEIIYFIQGRRNSSSEG